MQIQQSHSANQLCLRLEGMGRDCTGFHCTTGLINIIFNSCSANIYLFNDIFTTHFINNYISIGNGFFVDKIPEFSGGVLIPGPLGNSQLLTPLGYGRKEENVLFNDTLNTFYLQLYGIRHKVKDHSA